MNIIQSTMKVSKISELRGSQKETADLVSFRGVLTASLRICSIDAMKTQQITNVAEVVNEDIRL